MICRGAIFRRVLRNTFWDTYDCLGVIIVVSLMSFLAAVSVVALPFIFAGLSGLARRIAADRDATVAGFLAEARTGWARFAGLLLLDLLAAAVLFANVIFYANVGQRWGFAGLTMCILVIWVGLLFVAGQQFAMPLLARQGVPLRSALKRGYSFVLACPGVALLGLANLAALSVLLFVSAFGFLLLWPGTTALFLCHLLNETEAEMTGRADPRAHERRTIGGLFRPWRGET